MLLCMPSTTYLVTGNPHKLREWQRLLPTHFVLDAADIDLPEIQSLDSTEIVRDKARRAYEVIGKPVIVEDVSAGLDKLGGLPGPFIKYFEQRLGRDALYQLSHGKSPRVTVIANVCYYDGHDFTVAEADIHGEAVQARGDNGFGFDFCFVPDGHTKTFAEMTPAEKDAISHRSQAIKQLIEKLTDLA